MGLYYSKPKPKAIVLTLDAFGTLYRPRRPIGRQYADIAKAYGFQSLDADELDASFRHAFKRESAAHPNYGKAGGMEPESWWRNVMRNTFIPVLPANTKIPDTLVNTLYIHFSTKYAKHAYALYPDVLPFFNEMRRLRDELLSPGDNTPVHPMVIVGVISNSDNRIRGVMSSLGLRIAPEPDGPTQRMAFLDHREMLQGSKTASDPKRRPATTHWVNAPQTFKPVTSSENDIDFICTSYEASAEKPDRNIFKYAILLSPVLDEPANVVRIHVGDDYAKDYRGAEDSGGFHGLLLRRDLEQRDGELGHHVACVSSLIEIPTLLRMKLEGWS